jgi:hypothetical protein
VPGPVPALKGCDEVVFVDNGKLHVPSRH